MKKFFALILAIAMLFSLTQTSLAAGPSNVNQATMNHFLSQSQFAIGKYASSGPCWSFVNDLCKAMYGTGIGSIGDNRYTLKSGNWTLVIQKTGAQSQASIADALKKATPGCVVQYKNSKTSYQHTMIVHSVSSTSITVYDATTGNGIQKRTYKFTELNSKFGMFNSSIHGLSIYRCKKNPVYDYKWSEQVINKPGRIVNVEWYGLEPTPTQNSTKVAWIQGNVTVIASYINADGDTWMKVRTSDGKTGFIYKSYLKY